MGVLGPSVYLLSTVYQRFEEVVERIESEPELFFDSEGRLLFDVNTGEIVASYADDDRELFLKNLKNNSLDFFTCLFSHQS